MQHRARGAPWIEFFSATTSSSASTTCRRRRRARRRCASRTCSAIIEVLDAAYEEGIRTFMCTTHDRVAEICDHFRANPEKYPDYLFYPCMPYAHKYANAVTEHGMIERAAHVPAGGRRGRRDAQGRRGARQQGHRGDHAAADRRRDEDVPRPDDAGHLHAERHHRPAARPGHERRVPHLRRPRARTATAPSPASSP